MPQTGTQSQPRHTSRHRTLLAIAALLGVGLLIGWEANRRVKALRLENRLQFQANEARSLTDELEQSVFTRFADVARRLACADEVIAVAEGIAKPDNPEIMLALGSVQRALDAEFVYVLNREGTGVACTRRAGETFTGKNYAFRPYFVEAMAGRDHICAGVGITTGLRGLWFASPVIRKPGEAPIGVLIVKAGFEKIDGLLQHRQDPAALISPDGIILASNRSEWLYHAAFPLATAKRDALRASKQFAAHPLNPLNPSLGGDEVALDSTRFSIAHVPIPLTGWRVITLQRTDRPTELTAPQTRALLFGAGFAVFLLASVALLAAGVVQRRRNEAALRRANDALENRVQERTCELAATNEELRRSQRRLTDIIDFLPDATFAIDCHGRITAWNRAIEQLSGKKAADMLGKGDHEYALCFYGIRRPILIDYALNENDDTASRYQTLKRHGDTIVTEAHAPGLGEGVVVWGAAKRLYDPEGNIIGAIESVRDISERKRQEQDLQRAKEAAEAATLTKSAFLANMSHEIRTPMGAILGFADMLAEGCPGQCGFGESAFQDYIATIRRNSDHLLQLLGDILDLSRIEAGRMVIERMRCSPLHLIEDVRALMQARAADKGLNLEIKVCGPVPETIHSDPTRIRQILVNLVGNAIKFTETGGVRLEIRLQADSQLGQADDASPTAPHIQFDVIDTGIGLSESQIAELFQPFTQADASTTRKYGGSGLGLAICKRLTALLGGDIQVSSRPGHGSTFRVTIATGPLEGVPMVTSLDTSNLPRSAAPADRRPAAGGLSDTRILLAEDGPDNQRLISTILQKAGAKVTTVANGQDAVDTALTAAVTEPFDVILMDMQMPVLDGYDATRQLRDRGYAGPVIALTAHAMSGDREKCLAAGCSDFTTKPIRRESLLAIITETLAKAQPSATPALV